MKIGRLVRTQGWDVIVPANLGNSLVGNSLHQSEIKAYGLVNPKANFMCASACFFVFVGGISKTDGLYGVGASPPIIGIHRPYLEPERLKDLRGNQVIATANLTKAGVETYLKGMDVPTKYFDQMFSVPKDNIFWISDDDFKADFAGLLPSLRDWVDAKCTLTDVENVALKAIQKKPFDKRTQAEWDVEKLLNKKQWDCEQQVKFELRKDAWQQWLKGALQEIAGMCATRKRSLPGEIRTALSTAIANRQSATIALRLAQTAGLCGDYETRENAVGVLANRGDAKAQRILGNFFYNGAKTIAKDPVQGMTWYGRAGAQGDLFAEKYYRDLSGKVSDKNHVWTNDEYSQIGGWIVGHNCPALC
jgi:hypothetical protein